MACWRCCPAGVVLEGLQDLLVQYLQLKLEFGVADVVREGMQALLLDAWPNQCMSALGARHPHATAQLATRARQLSCTQCHAPLCSPRSS